MSQAEGLLPPRLLTITEAAPYLRRSARQAYRDIKAGTFPLEVVMVGAVMMVRSVDIHRLLTGDKYEVA